MLPDNVLLEIFDFYRQGQYHTIHEHTMWQIWNWNLLVHVCYRWRLAIFASPRRLNLQIFCTLRTPVRERLCVWPAFPIVMDYYYHSSISPGDEDNVVAALKHFDRVCGVRLALMDSQLGRITEVMKEPFPLLTRLWFRSASKGGNGPGIGSLPAEFLGKHAPCLQEFGLDGIPYPTLPKLLLSANDLIKLHLCDIPLAGYISPEAMAAGFVALTRLESFILEFRSADSRPDRMRPPPVTRTILPSLTFFHFQGTSEYLEDLVSRIEGPKLNEVLAFYLNQIVDFQVPQFSKFIDRSVGPKITLCRRLGVTFYRDKVAFDIYLHPTHSFWDPSPTKIIVLCEGIDWQLSHMAQLLSQFSTSLSNVVHVTLEVQHEDDGNDQFFSESSDGVEWLHLLHQFSTVQTLHVYRELAAFIATALENITTEMAAEIMPFLHLIHLEGQPASSIETFLSARQLSARPVIVINAATEFEQRFQNYVSN